MWLSGITGLARAYNGIMSWLSKMLCLITGGTCIRRDTYYRNHITHDRWCTVEPSEEIVFDLGELGLLFLIPHACLCTQLAVWD